MDIKPKSIIRTDWERLIAIFASKFDENEWTEILNQTQPVSVSIEGVPQDTLRVLVSLFGLDRGIQWLYHDKTYRNEPIIDFLNSYSNKQLAVKAVNHRVVKLYKNNLNDSFYNTIKENYRNWNWDSYINDLEKYGYYRECYHDVAGVDHSIVNVVYSSLLSEEDKVAFFSTPIYELHGMTPVELSNNEEGCKKLKLYIQYLGALKNAGSGM